MNGDWMDLLRVLIYVASGGLIFEWGRRTGRKESR